MARNDAVRIILILGAIVAIIQAVLMIIPHLANIINAIIIIVLAIILLASVGAIHTKHRINAFHWLIMIIFGAIIWYFGAEIGGIIIIIAGIVALILYL